jgi:hypothetical protein
MKFKRKIADTEQILTCLYDLKRSFHNSDDFFTVMLKQVLKQQVTVRELEIVVDKLIANHKGALFVADVVELCMAQKKYRLADEILERLYHSGQSLPDGIEIDAAQTNRKGENFERNPLGGIRV